MQFKRLKIIDFGSIRNMELHFEPNRVYYFYSENDNGKSTVIEAMETLCMNMPSIHVPKYVSDYGEFFYIEGEDFDGNVITLKKGVGEALYTLKRADGSKEKFDKVHSGVPTEIAQIVNVYYDSERKELFNIRKHSDKVLFVHTTPGENYSYFQKALRTDQVRQKIKESSQIKSSIVKELDIISGKIELEKAKLDEYVDLTADKQLIDSYAEEVSRTIEQLKKIDRLLELNAILDTQITEIPKELLEFDKVAMATEVNSVLKLSRLMQLLETLTNQNALISVYTEIKSITDVIDLDKSILLSLDLYDRYVTALNKLETKLALSTDISTMSSELVTLQSIKSKFESFDTVYSSIVDHSSLLATRQSELVAAKSELDGFMKVNNYCPVVSERDDQLCPFSKKTLVELSLEVPNG